MKAAEYARYSTDRQTENSIAYQFKGPWVIDSSATSQALGVYPTDWNSVVRRSAQGNADGPPAAV